jgi:hypothetical protein
VVTALLEEQRKVAEIFEEAHAIRAIAHELPDRRVREALERSTDRMIAATIDPVRVKIVTFVLHFDDKTIRRWVDLGILPAVEEKPRLAVDPVRLFEVAEVVRALRERRYERDFTNAVWSALQDRAVLDDPELGTALEQMAVGSRRRWTERPDGSWGPAE